MKKNENPWLNENPWPNDEALRSLGRVDLHDHGRCAPSPAQPRRANIVVPGMSTEAAVTLMERMLDEPGMDSMHDFTSYVLARSPNGTPRNEALAWNELLDPVVICRLLVEARYRQTHLNHTVRRLLGAARATPLEAPPLPILWPPKRALSQHEGVPGWLQMTWYNIIGTWFYGLSELAVVRLRMKAAFARTVSRVAKGLLVALDWVSPGVAVELMVEGLYGYRRLLIDTLPHVGNEPQQVTLFDEPQAQ